MSKDVQIELAAQAAADLIPIVKSKRDELVEMALSQVTETEAPGGKNKIKYNTWFYGREVHDGDKPGAKYPWCCTFIAWVFNQIGKKWPRADYNNGWSSVPNIYRYAYQRQMLTVDPKPGDLVIYEWDGGIKHIGVFLRYEGASIVNIEGNTSFNEAGSQDNGGGCAIKTRKPALVKAFINVDKFLQ